MSKTPYNAACGCNLRHPAKAVLKELAWFADDEGQNIWPSVQTLADRTGLTRRAVQKLLRQLEEAGAIQAIGSRLGGRRKTTRYRMDLDWLRAKAETANRLRPFVLQNVGANRNDEPRNNERANGSAENSESRSPKQNEHEYEQNSKTLSEKRKEPQSKPYEVQRAHQALRSFGRQHSFQAQLSKKEIQERRAFLRSQLVKLAERASSGEKLSERK